MSPQTSCIIVIPARYDSHRLPGKPLADIHGKPMIQHVYERASQVHGVSMVVVATDDTRIADAVKAFGGKAELTKPTHASGTDRLAEIMGRISADIYVNLQGDEPLVRPADIDKMLVDMLADPTIHVGTLCHAITADEAANPNTVKVVLAENNDALYFSRAPIPYPWDETVSATYLKHIGVYAYRRKALETYRQLAQPTMEKSEKLEQLRLLAAGIRMKVFTVETTGPGVDTPACLEQVRSIIAGKVAPQKPTLTLMERLKNIRLVITDVDGVLTDGGIYYNEAGECLKRFHVRDGLGIRLLEESGIRVAILSGRDSATLRKRTSDLGISLFQLGVKDKATACDDLMRQAGVTKEQAACIGDDSIDLPAFAACGISVVVADAPTYVQKNASHVLSSKGGQGAFRELADMILLAQNKNQVFDSAQGFKSVMENMDQ